MHTTKSSSPSSYQQAKQMALNNGRSINPFCSKIAHMLGETKLDVSYPGPGKQKGYDVRSADHFFSQQASRKLVGAFAKDIMIHGDFPAKGEAFHIHSNHRGYFDGLIIKSIFKRPPIMMASAHTGKNRQGIKYYVERVVHSIVLWSRALIVPEFRHEHYNSVERTLLRMKKGESLWAASEGKIGDPAKKGAVSSEEIRNGVTVISLKMAAEQRVSQYAMAIGKGSNQMMHYASARFLGSIKKLEKAAPYYFASFALLTAAFFKAKWPAGLVALFYRFCFQKGLANLQSALLKMPIMEEKPRVHIFLKKIPVENSGPLKQERPAEHVMAKRKRLIASHINEALHSVKKLEAIEQILKKP